MNPNYDILTGLSDRHIVHSMNFKRPMHRDAEAAFTRLRDRAREDGIEIYIVSCFRGHQRQLDGWNRKARGEKALIALDGSILDYHSLSPNELLDAILRWSAVPGASRHHWGTDFDIYDKNTLPDDYHIELTREEYDAENGMFGALTRWLDERIQAQDSEGFFRPYEPGRQGGVAEEKWHLSFAPIAEEYRVHYTIDIFEKIVRESDVLLKAELMQRLEEIYATYVQNVTPPPFT